MYKIYDPRKNNDFIFSGFSKSKFSTLENNILLYYSDSEEQVLNTNIVFNLFKEFYEGSSCFLFISKEYNKQIEKLKKFLEIDDDKFDENLYLEFDFNSNIFKKIKFFYQENTSYEEWILGSIKKGFEKRNKELVYGDNSTFEYEDFLVIGKMEFNCLFLINFDVPEIYLSFFNEEVFSDVMYAIPIV